MCYYQMAGNSQSPYAGIGRRKLMSVTMTSGRLASLTAAVTRASGELRLTHPERGYAVSRNPFTVWAVLPSITLATAVLAIAMLFISDAYLASIAAGAYLFVTAGVLLIPAVALKGSLSLTHDGIVFQRGKQNLTAGWERVTGILFRRGPGLSLVIRDPEQSTPSIRAPGGFYATQGEANIPLRMFGDRQFSILYDIRDRLPQSAWRDAVNRASSRSQIRILLVYAAVVAVACGALFAVMYAVTH
jgi:hypothetical protein